MEKINCTFLDKKKCQNSLTKTNIWNTCLLLKGKQCEYQAKNIKIEMIKLFDELKFDEIIKYTQSNSVENGLMTILHDKKYNSLKEYIFSQNLFEGPIYDSSKLSQEYVEYKNNNYKTIVENHKYIEIHKYFFTHRYNETSFVKNLSLSQRQELFDYIIINKHFDLLSLIFSDIYNDNYYQNGMNKINLQKLNLLSAEQIKNSGDLKEYLKLLTTDKIFTLFESNLDKIKALEINKFHNFTSEQFVLIKQIETNLYKYWDNIINFDVTKYFTDDEIIAFLQEHKYINYNSYLINIFQNNQVLLTEYIKHSSQNHNELNELLDEKDINIITYALLYSQLHKIDNQDDLILWLSKFNISDDERKEIIKKKYQ